MNRNKTKVLIGAVSFVMILWQAAPIIADETEKGFSAGIEKGELEIPKDKTGGFDTGSGFGETLDFLGFSMTTFDGKKISLNASIDLDELKKYEQKGADDYLSSVFGSPYQNTDESSFRSELPDTEEKDMNSMFEKMKTSMGKEAEGIGDGFTDFSDTEAEASNVKEAFENAWGDLSSSLKEKEYQIPDDFNPEEKLKDGIKNRDETFHDLYSSDAYREAKKRLNVEDIFSSASSGPGQGSLSSNSELASRLSGMKDKVAGNISGISSSLKDKYQSGSSAAKEKKDKAQKQNQEDYNDRKGTFLDEYISSKEKNSLAGQAESLFSE